MKRILLILSIILLSFITVNASTLDLNTKGSIDITIKYNDEEPIVGATIELYKVASLIVNEDGNIEYKYVEELSGEVFKLNELTGVVSTDSEADQVEKGIKAAKKIDYSSLTPILEGNTDSKGNVKFENLELGLYLVIQSNQVKGYTKLDPYLLTIPTSTNGEWVYDVTSLPKPEIEKLADLTIKKIWNNSTNEKLPDTIIVDILNDNELLETIVLSEENSWTLTLEDVPYSDSYSVEEKNVPAGFNVSYSQEGLFDFTIINTSKLPQTGAFTFIVPMLITFGVALIIVGFYLEKKD